MLRIAFVCTLVLCNVAGNNSTQSGGQWYDGIDGIKVLTPGDTMDWWSFYQGMRKAQFSSKRYAILLTSGDYPSAEIGVGYYTSIIGVGASRSDVTVKSFYSLDLNDDGSGGGATCNFWRSVEGLTATGSNGVSWATSQACPVRRCSVRGDMALSMNGPTSYSSGGFLGDTEVQGKLSCGSQQQFFFRNSRFQGGVDCAGITNGAFVGTKGEGNQPSQISVVGSTPTVAEKPYLVESNGIWHIAVPKMKTDSSDLANELDVSSIPFDSVFVARATHSVEQINDGIQGKKALLLTPGIYNLNSAISISQADFVVLGIGFPTLVSQNGNSAMVVEVSASGVRIAQVLFESGSASSQETRPLLSWKGAQGVGSDIFSRVGSFSYSGCPVTRADVHVHVEGDSTVLDNTWLWHADHDDCGGKSDQSIDGYGLLVDGMGVTTYGLKVEHTFDNLVQWNGEDGTVFFYQSELPYHTSFGTSGHSGYVVAPTVSRHHATALGVYIIFAQEQQVTAFRFPPGVDVTNIIGWCITGSASQFEHLVCVGSQCYAGDCSYSKCRLGSLPGPSPSPSPSGSFELRSRASGLCIDLDSNGNFQDGTKVQIWDCTGWDGQLFEFRGDAIVNPHSGKCLDIDSNGNFQDGTQVQLWDCSGWDGQKWEMNGNEVKNSHSGKCLDVDTGGGSKDGSKVQIWDCAGSANQQFDRSHASLFTNDQVNLGELVV